MRVNTCDFKVVIFDKPSFCVIILTWLSLIGHLQCHYLTQLSLTGNLLMLLFVTWLSLIGHLLVSLFLTCLSLMGHLLIKLFTISHNGSLFFHLNYRKLKIQSLCVFGPKVSKYQGEQFLCYILAYKSRYPGYPYFKNSHNACDAK